MLMTGIRKRGRVYYYRYTDADGTKREVKGCSDYRVTEDIARKVQSDVARRRAGRMTRARSLRDHGARSLADHLDTFEADLAAREIDVAKHIRLFADRARRVPRWLAGADRTRSTSPDVRPPADRDRRRRGH